MGQRAKLVCCAMMGLLFTLSQADAWAETPERVPYLVDLKLTQGQGKRVEATVRGHQLAVDQPAAFGGADSAPTPPETYAFALGACLVSAVRFVAAMENAPITGIEARVSGTLDFARAMGKPGAPRAGFAGLTVEVKFDVPWKAEDKAAFLARVVARCPVCDNTAEQTPLKVTLAP